MRTLVVVVVVVMGTLGTPKSKKSSLPPSKENPKSLGLLRPPILSHYGS
jgi:hypothetical protein